MRKSILLSVGLLVAACSVRTQLVPDVRATRVRDITPDQSSSAAVAEVAASRVTVDGSAWRGNPRNLTESITPVLVTIENHSDRPLSISSAAISLVGAKGDVYRALPVLPGP